MTNPRSPSRGFRGFRLARRAQDPDNRVVLLLAYILWVAVGTAIVVPVARDKGLAAWPLVILVVILPIVSIIITLVMQPNPDSPADVRRRGKYAGYKAAITESDGAPSGNETGWARLMRYDVSQG
jgi:hypothetical protein